MLKTRERLTANNVIDTFKEQTFIDSLSELEHILESHEKVLQPGRGIYTLEEDEEKIRERINQVLNSNIREGIFHGRYTFDNNFLPSIGVFDTRIMTIAQYIKITNNFPLFSSEYSEMFPFLGVSIWASRDRKDKWDVSGLKGVSEAGNMQYSLGEWRRVHSSYDVNWPEEIDGLPVRYHIGEKNYGSIPRDGIWRGIEAQ